MKEYYVNDIIDGLWDFNIKSSGGKFDGKITSERLMKIIEKCEAE